MLEKCHRSALLVGKLFSIITRKWLSDSIYTHPRRSFSQLGDDFVLDLVSISNWVISSPRRFLSINFKFDFDFYDFDGVSFLMPILVCGSLCLICILYWIRFHFFRQLLSQRFPSQSQSEWQLRQIECGKCESEYKKKNV